MFRRKQNVITYSECIPAKQKIIHLFSPSNFSVQLPLHYFIIIFCLRKCPNNISKINIFFIFLFYRNLGTSEPTLSPGNLEQPISLRFLPPFFFLFFFYNFFSPILQKILLCRILRLKIMNRYHLVRVL